MRSSTGVRRPRAAPLLPLALAIAALWGLLLGRPASAQEVAPPALTRTAAPADGPARSDGRPASRVDARIGFYVLNIREVNTRAQSFVADFYMWLVYPACDADGQKRIEHLEFMNGTPSYRDENDRVEQDGLVYVCWRVTGTFYFTADLRRYPFDRQRFPIQVEQAELQSDQMRLVDDVGSYRKTGADESVWGTRQGLSIPEFRLVSVRREGVEWRYDTDFGNLFRGAASASRYSRFTIEAEFERDFMPYFFKIAVPLAVICAMAYLIFLLPPKEIQTASGIGITALLSCIAFNVSVGQNLPEVGYLVVSDQFFLLTYALLFLSLFQSVLAYALEDRGRHELAVRWLFCCRIVAPILFLASFAWLLANAMR